jgi:antitoxin component of RelBE/YafQ-DinJ toxin-antitoxin module
MEEVTLKNKEIQTLINELRRSASLASFATVEESPHENAEYKEREEIRKSKPFMRAYTKLRTGLFFDFAKICRSLGLDMDTVMRDMVLAFVAAQRGVPVSTLIELELGWVEAYRDNIAARNLVFDAMFEKAGEDLDIGVIIPEVKEILARDTESLLSIGSMIRNGEISFTDEQVEAMKRARDAFKASKFVGKGKTLLKVRKPRGRVKKHEDRGFDLIKAIPSVRHEARRMKRI